MSRRGPSRLAVEELFREIDSWNLNIGRQNFTNHTPYDREIDVMIAAFRVDLEATFLNTLGRPGLLHKDAGAGDRNPHMSEQRLSFLIFPPNVRYKIYDHVFSVPHEAGIITLAKRLCTQAVFPDDYFLSFAETWGPGKSLSETCRQVRSEMAIFFWSHYKFHVTISAFEDDAFNPNKDFVLVKHIVLIQKIAIEVDLTMFGWGFTPSDIRNAQSKITETQASLEEFLSHLMCHWRGRRGPIAEVHLMCRRFTPTTYLLRPGLSILDTHAPVSIAPLTPDYCADGSLRRFREALLYLEQRTLTMRISGFSLDFTTSVIRNLFSSVGTSNFDKVWVWDAESPREQPAWPDYSVDLFLFDPHVRDSLGFLPLPPTVRAPPPCTNIGGYRSYTGSKGSRVCLRRPIERGKTHIYQRAQGQR